MSKLDISIHLNVKHRLGIFGHDLGKQDTICNWEYDQKGNGYKIGKKAQQIRTNVRGSIAIKHDTNVCTNYLDIS